MSPPIMLYIRLTYLGKGYSNMASTADSRVFHISTDAPVTVPLFLTTRIFKNPYCALCSLDSHEINDVCSTDLLSDSRSMGTNSLTVLLNVQSPAQSDVRTDTRCAYKETFDYVTVCGLTCDLRHHFLFVVFAK